MFVSQESGLQLVRSSASKRYCAYTIYPAVLRCLPGNAFDVYTVFQITAPLSLLQYLWFC